MQKLIATRPETLADLLDREIAPLFAIVDRVLADNLAKKQPKSIKGKAAKREAYAGA